MDRGRLRVQTGDSVIGTRVKYHGTQVHGGERCLEIILGDQQYLPLERECTRVPAP